MPTVFTLPLADGDTLTIDELGLLYREPPQGEALLVDILHWARVDKILAAKTPKRAENLIRMAIKTGRRQQRQHMRRERAWAKTN